MVNIERLKDMCKFFWYNQSVDRPDTRLQSTFHYHTVCINYNLLDSHTTHRIHCIQGTIWVDLFGQLWSPVSLLALMDSDNTERVVEDYRLLFCNQKRFRQDIYTRQKCRSHTGDTWSNRLVQVKNYTYQYTLKWILKLR